MLCDPSIDQFAAMRLKPRKRPLLVRTHEPAITGDVRSENGGQLAFDAFRSQSGLPPHGPNGSSALGPILTVLFVIVMACCVHVASDTLRGLGCGCSRKKRSISCVASGPRGSVWEPAGLPPDQPWPAP